MRHYDDKPKNLNFDNYFFNVIFSQTIVYMVQILLAHSSDPFGGNRVSDFFRGP